MTMLGDAGLADRASVVMEKPFGTDLESARVLVTRNERVTPWVEPSTRKIQVGEALPLAARPEASSDLAVPSATPPTRSMDEIRSAFAQIVPT